MTKLPELVDLEPVEAPGPYVISPERLHEQLLWALREHRANCFIQLWTSEGKSVVSVVDLYDDRWPTKSVTNDAEAITRIVHTLHGDVPIVYRDTEGNWDELRHREGHFACFRVLGTLDVEDAMQRVLALHELDALDREGGGVN
jgi:hypothetical protein